MESSVGNHNQNTIERLCGRLDTVKATLKTAEFARAKLVDQLRKEKAQLVKK